MSESIDEIKHNNEIIAIVVPSGFSSSGIKFFTPCDFSQQLGYMKREKGYDIQAHVHNEIRREVNLTQEVLFIRKGCVRIDLYSKDKTYLKSVVLGAGDIILLASGGHGLSFLEESEIVEVKQGPHAGELDKSRFEGIRKA